MLNDHHAIIEHTAHIVSSYVQKNAVPASDLPTLIAATFASLSGLGSKEMQAIEEKPTPAVPVKKSVTDDFIICLEDGKKFKSLKRHLMTHYALTPEEYRQRWGLPSDYPMVAPNYAAARSRLAKSMGLGRKPGTPAPTKAGKGRKPKVAE